MEITESLFRVSANFWNAASFIFSEVTELLSYEFTVSGSTYSVMDVLFGLAVFAIAVYTLIKWVIPV